MHAAPRHPEHTDPVIRWHGGDRASRFERALLIGLFSLVGAMAVAILSAAASGG